MNNFYELTPIDNRKSFYGKARVEMCDDGSEILWSYDTAVLKRDPDGNLIRLWPGWSLTTGRHIAAFAGINKKAWDMLPVSGWDQ